EFKFINAPSRARRVVEMGDIIISTVRPYLMAFAQIKAQHDNMICSTGFAVLRSKKHIDNNFLYQIIICNPFVEYLKSKMTGSNYPAVKVNDLKHYTFSLPPLMEQQKIAAILSSVDEAIEKTEQIIEQTEKVKKGLMQQLLTKGIGHTEFKKTAIGEIPVEWEIKDFQHLMILQRGFDLPVHKRVQGDNPLLSANGVTDYIDQYKVEGPGIITGRSGTIGKVHYIAENFWPLNTSLYIKEMYNNDPRFLYYFLINFKLERFATGTGVPTLNRNIVHQENVAIPSVNEQKHIAARLTKIDENVEYEVKYLNQLKNLKKSLMQVLLTGKVRVPIDDPEVVET